MCRRYWISCYEPKLVHFFPFSIPTFPTGIAVRIFQYPPPRIVSSAPIGHTQTILMQSTIIS
jgi:hypothetical protein